MALETPTVDQPRALPEIDSFARTSVVPVSVDDHDVEIEARNDVTMAEAFQDNFSATSNGASDGFAETPVEAKVVLGADSILITLRSSQTEMRSPCQLAVSQCWLPSLHAVCVVHSLDLLRNIAQGQTIEADTVKVCCFLTS